MISFITKILSLTHRKCQSKPNIWILSPLKNKHGYSKLYCGIKSSHCHTIYLYNKKFNWLFIVDPIWLVWHTVHTSLTHHSLTDSLIHWPVQNIPDALTKRYFFFKKITQKFWESYCQDGQFYHGVATCSCRKFFSEFFTQFLTNFWPLRRSVWSGYHWKDLFTTVEHRLYCPFWSNMMLSEVEQGPRLVTGGYGQHRNRWIKAVSSVKSSLLAEVSHDEAKWNERRDLCRLPTSFLSRMHSRFLNNQWRFCHVRHNKENRFGLVHQQFASWLQLYQSVITILTSNSCSETHQPLVL